MRFHHIASAAVAIGVAASSAAAQAPPDSVPARDVAAFTSAVHRAQLALAADRGRLWRARLDTVRWMGTENGRVWLTADPQATGYVRDGTMWTGALPAGISPSNTSVTWSGHRWAMVMLQHLGDSTEADRLLVHEAMHTMQPALLPAPTYNETGAGSRLLDEADGRTLLRLEWRALATALRAHAGIDGVGGRARLDAIHDVLVFRATRYALASPDEIVRERALDVAEGLPEYTAWRITRSPRRDFIAALDSAPARMPSFVRGFVYYTGPAYTLLLDDYEDGAWRRSVHALPDLQRLLLVAWRDRARSDGIATLMNDAFAGHTLTRADRARLASLAHDLAARYDGVAIAREEDTRWAARAAARGIPREVRERTHAAAASTLAQHQLRSARPGIARRRGDRDGQPGVARSRRRRAARAGWRTRHAELGRGARAARRPAARPGRARRTALAAR